MKKFAKVMLIIAAVFMALGIGLTVGGAAMGATLEDDVFSKEDFHDVWEKVSWFHSDHDWDFDGEEVTAQADDGDVRTYDLKDAKELDISLHSDELTIEEWSQDTIRVEVENDAAGNVKVASSTGKIEIESGKTKSGRKVTVYYPRGMQFTSVEIEIGAGCVYMESDLNTTELDVSIEAGELYGYGKITAQETDMEVGAGNMEFYLLDTGKLDGECGMGNMSVTLTGSEEDYFFDVECAMGNISVGDKEYSGFAGEHKWGSSSGREVDLECGMGNIEVFFDE